jgi:hypothetical protein
MLCFNPKKCMVMHLRYNLNTDNEMAVNHNMWLETLQQEKDLGIWITGQLGLSLQCSKEAATATSVLRIVK